MDSVVEIIDEVEKVTKDLHPQVDENLPPIKLFISVDQLAELKKSDADRELHAKMFLTPKEESLEVDTAVFNEFKVKFDKAFSKLGNENKCCPYCKREYASAPAEVKQCLGCGKGFFKTKRPQDGQTVLVREEQRELMSLQWKNIKKAELIERINLNALEKVRQRMEQRDAKRYSIYNAHFTLVKQHTAKALVSGRFRLYSSFIYYMAEHDRYKKDFATALMYYFYLYYMQLNGASNSIVFGDKVSVNVRIIKRIANLLNMINTPATECAEFFEYAIKKTTAFELENLPYSITDAYAHLVQAFKEEDRRKNPRKIEKKIKGNLFKQTLFHAF